MDILTCSASYQNDVSISLTHLVLAMATISNTFTNNTNSLIAP